MEHASWNENNPPPQASRSIGMANERKTADSNGEGDIDYYIPPTSHSYAIMVMISSIDMYFSKLSVFLRNMADQNTLKQMHRTQMKASQSICQYHGKISYLWHVYTCTHACAYAHTHTYTCSWECHSPKNKVQYPWRTQSPVSMPRPALPAM